MNSTCPKCKGELGHSDVECPHCGIVLAKFRDPSDLPPNVWLVVVNDREFRTSYEHLKVWIAEDRVKSTDRVKKLGAPWKTVGDYPELLITISTGDIHTRYEPIDAIFAYDSHTTGSLLGGGAGDPNRAFDGVKKQLRLLCRAMGGHAVINCEFEYRVASRGAALIGSDQVIEIFAYGTAVRFQLPTEGATTV